MDLSGLSLDQAPPYKTVLRFFVTAPAFLLVAGVALLLLPGSPFDAMLSGNLIGLTHILTLGFMTMTMFGAFFQMLPVVAGVKIPNPAIVTGVVYALLLGGVTLFAGAFLFGRVEPMMAAAALLFLAVSAFVFRIIFKLFAVNASDTIRAMRLSLFSLLILMLLGVTMLLWRLGLIPPIEANLLPVHVGWGIFGWVMLLVMGVSFQVIPMFYVAPVYPRFVRKFFPPVLFVLLLIYTMESFWFYNREFLLGLTRILVYWLSGVFAIVTLRVISKRKRKLPDPSLLFWKTSMGFLSASAIFATAAEFYRGRFEVELVVLTGVFLVAGFAVSLITGMMYKIVPFLSWFHLASRGIFDAPTMKDMLPDNRIITHYFTWAAFLLSTLSIVILPAYAGKIMGALLSIASIFLWVNLLTVTGKYRVTSRKHRQS